MVSLTVVIVMPACSSESSGPAGSTGGELDKDCGYGGCDSEEAKEAASASDVWCAWRNGHVIVHLTLENGLNAHVTAQVVPRYEIENGGVHGTSLGSDQGVSVDAASTRSVTLDAGAPEGVPADTPIAKCSPRLLDINITNP